MKKAYMNSASLKRQHQDVLKFFHLYVSHQQHTSHLFCNTHTAQFCSNILVPYIVRHILTLKVVKVCHSPLTRLLAVKQ